MKTYLQSIAAVALLASAAAHAAPAANDVDCSSRHLIQIDLNVCGQRAFDGQDRKLNALYAKLLTIGLDPKSTARLKAAQRAWLRFRDLDCDFESFGMAGSGGPYQSSMCKAELTKERIVDLKRALADMDR